MPMPSGPMPPWWELTEGILRTLGALQLRRMRRHADISPRTSGVALQVVGSSRRRSPVSLSEQEVYVLRHDQELLAERALAVLRPLVLTWLEAAVLLHHYCYGWRLPDVAAIVRRHRFEVYAARDSLVRKAAVALGYIPGDVERAELPVTAEERRQALVDLLRQGVPPTEIARRLGVTKEAVYYHRKKLQAHLAP